MGQVDLVGDYRVNELIGNQRYVHPRRPTLDIPGTAVAHDRHHIATLSFQEDQVLG